MRPAAHFLASAVCYYYLPGALVSFKDCTIIKILDHELAAVRSGVVHSLTLWAVCHRLAAVILYSGITDLAGKLGVLAVCQGKVNHFVRAVENTHKLRGRFVCYVNVTG